MLGCLPAPQHPLTVRNFFLEFPAGDTALGLANEDGLWEVWRVEQMGAVVSYSCCGSADPSVSSCFVLRAARWGSFPGSISCAHAGMQAVSDRLVL